MQGSKEPRTLGWRREGPQEQAVRTLQKKLFLSSCQGNLTLAQGATACKLVRDIAEEHTVPSSRPILSLLEQELQCSNQAWSQARGHWGQGNELQLLLAL